ncbi:MAG: Nif3-like dinuclear metal center hexameric protein [Spirochaetes bacterium]|jgi:dinuclear metal center YbgI/SA1388 family protein|nr:Nif3-like dinuclear metal center hexameric protein [Spirochaetota bacterium]
MKVRTILEFFRSRYPENLQEPYDNSGEQYCLLDDELSGLMLALDVNEAVVDQALEKGCNLIVTHHPLIFKPIKKISSESVTDRIICSLIKNDISLYSLHTNLDCVYWEKSAQMLGLENRQVLIPQKDSDYGFGALGTLPGAMKMSEVLDLVVKTYGNEYLQYVGDSNTEVFTVAVLAGSGSSLIGEMSNRKIDLFITGDIKYHDAYEAKLAGLNLIDFGHFNSEIHYIRFLASQIQDYLTNAGDKTGINVYHSGKSPFKIFRIENEGL